MLTETLANIHGIEPKIDPKRFLEPLTKLFFEGAEVATVARNSNLPKRKLHFFLSLMKQRIIAGDSEMVCRRKLHQIIGLDAKGL